MEIYIYIYIYIYYIYIYKYRYIKYRNLIYFRICNFFKTGVNTLVIGTCKVQFRQLSYVSNRTTMKRESLT